MKLQNPQLQDLLAAEYVMGTLIGQARIRFEHYMLVIPELRDSVELWSQKLDGLNQVIKPVTPPAHVWNKIEQRLGLKPKPKNKFLNSMSFWKLSTAISLSIAIIVVSYLTQLPLTDSQPQYVTILNNQQSQSSWLVSVNLASNTLRVKAVKQQVLAADKDFELWLLPTAKQPPISMGLIPAKGSRDITLSPQLKKRLIATLHNAVGMAVSVEPNGGSPTGAPTGAVLYQGKIELI